MHAARRTSAIAVPLQVIFCRMSPLQHSLYKGFLASEPVAAALVRGQGRGEARGSMHCIAICGSLQGSFIH